MRVKKYLALTLAAALATCLLTACPWDIEDDAASSPSSVPSSSSRPSHDSDSSDDDSGSAPSSPSTPDEPEITVNTSGALQLPANQKTLSAEDITAIKNDIKTVNLTDIDVEQGTFAGCNSLTTVTIKNGTLNSGDKINGPFNNCEKLETVTLDGVTIKGFGTFGNCKNLHTVNLNNVDIENAKSTFYLCRELTTVTGADELTTIPQSMFSGCSSLPYIDISKATSIGNSAFAGCNSLKNIRVGTGLQEIGVSAFRAIASGGRLVPMELTVHCKDSKGEANAQLEEWFKDDDICGETNGYPKFEYNCNDEKWNQIVNESQAGGPDAGNALARYLLDLRL